MGQGRSIGDTLVYDSWAREHDEWLLAQQKVLTDKLEASVYPLFTLCFTDATAAPNSLDRFAARRLKEQSFQSWEAFVSAKNTQPLECSRFRLRTNGMSQVEQCEQALQLAKGQYIIIVPPRTALSQSALWFFANALSGEDKPLLIYSDSDRIDYSGNRIEPNLRNAWDPDLSLAFASMGSIYAVSTTLAREVGGYCDFEDIDATLHDLVLRAASRLPATKICHIPAVLWHKLGWTNPALSVDGSALRAVIRKHITQDYPDVSVERIPQLPAASRVRWRLPLEIPIVTIIIPFRDKADVLRQCVKGILERTDYASFEVLLIDNLSVEMETVNLLDEFRRDGRVRVLQFVKDFNFSAINNFAVREASGDIIIFLNNDTDVIHPEWLTELVTLVLRPGVGAVGARLLYPDGRVQHCGVFVGPGGVVSHQFRLADTDDLGPMGELAVCRTVLAVTAACMAVRKSVFVEVGGFDEQHFTIEFNDIDFCLRLGDYGYRVVVTPNAELMHLESVTRGADNTMEKDLIRETEYLNFRRIWDPLLEGDSYYSPHVQFQSAATVLVSPITKCLLVSAYDEDQVSLQKVPPTSSNIGSQENASDGEEIELRVQSVARTREARQEAMRLRSQVEFLDSKLNEQAIILEATNAEVIALKAELLETREEAQHNKTRYDRVVQSTIWRASRPLRLTLLAVKVLFPSK